MQSLAVSWGAALWGAGPQGLGVGEPGGGARGLRQIHVCIWQSARSQLSEAGPLASCRGGRQGPGDTPPPKTRRCPLLFPRLSYLSLWMTQTLLSHPPRVLGSMLQGWSQQVPWGIWGRKLRRERGKGRLDSVSSLALALRSGWGSSEVCVPLH